MKKILPFILVSIIFLASCAPKTTLEQTSSKVVNTDSLVSLWNSAWNSNDSAAIASLMSNEIDLISMGKITKGLNDVATKFIGPNAKIIRNLKTSAISTGSSENQAYYFGTYSHDIAMKDSIQHDITGTFSFIYIKDGDRWLLKVAEIE